MPTVSLTLPEITQAVIRPIVYDIIGQVQHITKIDPSTKIYFSGDSGKRQTSGSSIDSDTDRLAVFNTNRMAFIEVEEEYDIGAIGTTAVTRGEQLPVFIDEALGVHIAPVYASTDMVINFKYRCPSKTEAIRWRDDIRIRVSQMNNIFMHSVTYHYMLPIEAIVLTQAIHANREANFGYGETYEEYMTAHSTPRLTLVGDLTNKSSSLVISETQCRIIGLYGFDALPDKPEHDDGTGTWTISFSYKFSYEKPIGCAIRYPVIVHNQLLPQDLIDFTDKAYDIDKVNKSYSLSIDALHSFESGAIMNSRIIYDYEIKIPSYDDFIPGSYNKGMGTVLTALCEVDADKHTLLNLNELGDIAVDVDVMQFIKESELQYMGKAYFSILNLSLYRDKFLASSGTLSLDASLNVTSVNELDLRRQHRVMLSIVTDLTMLTKEALDRLRRYPKALVKIIGAINEILRNHPDFEKLSTKPVVTKRDLDPIYRMITGYSLSNGAKGTNSEYYGPGRNINSWPYSGNKYSDSKIGINNGMFSDIDPRVVENYRNNRIGNNTVMTTGIVAYKHNV